MKLSDCDINTKCEIVAVDVKDMKMKIRLCEIGFFVGGRVEVLRKSALKKTILISVLDCAFAIKLDVAKDIEVRYA